MIFPIQLAGWALPDRWRKLKVANHWPLAGETYECDRMDDLGWRAINEQVSHHPPMVAQYCEGRNWRCWQEFTMASKFRGKYMQIIPLGTAHLEFNNSGTAHSCEM